MSKEAKRRNNHKIPIFKSSGNVFADLRLPNAQEKHTKVRLAVAINHILAERRLSQTRAARHLRINQPKISALSRYRLDGFSVERLMHFLVRLGCDIEIVIRLHAKPRSKKKSPRILVSAA
jgi:predicted XRE-type DNA-binding protein